MTVPQEIIKDLIVGDPDCPFNKIVDVILKCTVAHLLLHNYKSLARKLGINEQKIQEYDTKLTLGQYQMPDVLLDILAQWRMHESRHATLNLLIDILFTDFTEIASSLQEKFGLPSTTIPRIPSNNCGLDEDSSPGTPTPSSSHVDVDISLAESPAAPTVPLLDGDDNTNTTEIQDNADVQDLELDQNNTPTIRNFKKFLFLFCCFSFILVQCGILTYQEYGKTSSTSWSSLKQRDGYTPDSLPEVEVYSNTYDDYTKKITGIPESRIRVTVDITHSLNWPPISYFLHPEHVVELRAKGELPCETIVRLLEKSSWMRYLEIEGCTCNDNTEVTPKSGSIALKNNIILPELRQLSLRSFPMCASMLSLFFNSVKVKHLTSFAFENGVMDDNNVHNLRNLLSFPMGISHLEINSTALIFKSVSYFIPAEHMCKLKNLTYDLFLPSKAHFRYPIFDNILQWSQRCKLEHLSSKNGYVDYPDILFCKDLVSLSTTVRIPTTVSLVNISIFVTHLTRLEHLVIVLDFMECPQQKLVGWEQLQSSRLYYYRVQSPCIIKGSSRVVEKVRAG